PVFNFFALPGFNDPATLNAIRTNLFKSQSSVLRTINVTLKGKLFELPAGDLAFAAGVGTGVEDLTSAVDGLFANGLALGYNPTLQASHAKSYTAGFVFSPKQVKGLSVTVDYYRIEQDKVGSIDYTAAVADLNAKGASSLYAQDTLKLGSGFVFADGTKLTSN